MKTAAERHFTKLATAGGLMLSATEIDDGIHNFVKFLRAAGAMEQNVNNEMRDFGADKQRQARQRIISAGANYTPERICRPAANGNTARICTY